MIRLDEPVTSGDNTYQYMYEDKNIVNGIEYTYSVVAYDMGVEPPFETGFKRWLYAHVIGNNRVGVFNAINDVFIFIHILVGIVT